MSADSHRDLIVEAIRVSSQPLDDDQLAARTGISPRQTVNQVCRALERAGMVWRRPGPDGKIVNEWLGLTSGGAREWVIGAPGLSECQPRQGVAAGEGLSCPGRGAVWPGGGRLT